jgi:hypothetical protein
MGIVVQPSSGEMPEVPDGLYRARITGVKSLTLDTPDTFGKTEKIDISVEFEVGDEIVTLDPRVNRAWSEKATLFQIAIACGLDVNPTEPFDAEELMDCEVNVLTEQPEGKWPRVKSWSKVGKGKASKAASRPSQAATEASMKEMPSVVNPDGSANYDVFWPAITSLGLNRSHVIAHVGGDIDSFMAMDGPDAQVVLEELAAIARS